MYFEDNKGSGGHQPASSEPQEWALDGTTEALGFSSGCERSGIDLDTCEPRSLAVATIGVTMSRVSLRLSVRD